jgi:hypothetical protein
MFVLLVLVVFSKCNAGAASCMENREFYFQDVKVEHRRYGPRLAKAVHDAEVKIIDVPLSHSGHYLVYASKPTGRPPMSRCGAGTEDVLLLLRHQNSMLTLLDKIDVQSCEQGMFLTNQDMEPPSDPLSFIEIKDGWIKF